MATRYKFLTALLVILAIDKHGGSEAARILGIFPLNGKSHFMMAEALMRGLAARGHQVDVISHFPLDNPPPNYRDISLVGTLPVTVNNLTLKEAERFAGGNGGMMELTHMAGTEFCDILGSPQIRNIIKNPPTNPPYDAAIVEIFAADCYLAFGRHLKIPIVGLVTSKLYDWINEPMGNPASPAFVPSCFSAFGRQMNFLERLQNVLFVNFVKAQYWYSVPVQLIGVEKYFNLKLSTIRDLYKDISVLLVNSQLSFDGPRPMTPGIVEVGGLHVADGDTDLSPKIKRWLNDSTYGCVYFAFGSMVKIESFPTETIKAFYEAFERITPVRVLMKIANEYELPEGLPKNVMTSPWLPQTRVLQHKNVKAFVTHGGLMSTQEAITYGVPMIGVPIFADQYHNVRLCEENKIAVALNYREITADSFTKALITILENSTYSHSSKRLAKLFTDRPMSAMDTATFWVEYVIRNGNVLRSSTDELSWWQVELLDVYAFLTAIVLIAIYIVKLSIVMAFTVLHSKIDLRHHLSMKSDVCHRFATKSKKIE